MKTFAVILLMLFVGKDVVIAQQTETDSCGKLEWLIPKIAVMQFAGNIGFFSGGVGYQYAKEKMELHLLYGYVPEKYGGDLHIATLKSTYLPFKKLPLCNTVTIDPLTLGIPISYTFGNSFFVVPPSDQYPKRYYDYSSAIRFGLFAGGRVNYNFPGNSCLKELGFYYELGTYDLLLHNYIFNTTHTPIHHIFSLGLGVRAKFGTPE